MPTTREKSLTRPKRKSPLEITAANLKTYLDDLGVKAATTAFRKHVYAPLTGITKVPVHDYFLGVYTDGEEGFLIATHGLSAPLYNYLAVNAPKHIFIFSKDFGYAVYNEQANITDFGPALYNYTARAFNQPFSVMDPIDNLVPFVLTYANPHPPTVNIETAVPALRNQLMNYYGDWKTVKASAKKIGETYCVFLDTYNQTDADPREVFHTGLDLGGAIMVLPLALFITFRTQHVAQHSLSANAAVAAGIILTYHVGAFANFVARSAVEVLIKLPLNTLYDWYNSVSVENDLVENEPNSTALVIYNPASHSDEQAESNLSRLQVSANGNLLPITPIRVNFDFSGQGLDISHIHPFILVALMHNLRPLGPVPGSKVIMNSAMLLPYLLDGASSYDELVCRVEEPDQLPICLVGAFLSLESSVQ